MKDACSQNRPSAKIIFNKKTIPASQISSRFQYQVYATPSVEFREFNIEDKLNESGGSSPQSSTTILNKSGIASLHMEAGGNIVFRYNTDLRLKAGLQLNYSNRQLSSNHNNEPTTPTESLIENTINLPATARRTLASENFQFSIPLGADWMIAGNDAIQWFAGATVQPSFLLPGNNHLMITGSEFVDKLDMASIRNFNIHGGLETFVSFKMARDVKIGRAHV